MENQEQPSLFDRFNAWLRTSVMLKLLVIGILVLVLMIPANMLNSLIRERESNRNTAIAEVSSKWGEAQFIGGPILTLPYQETYQDAKNNKLQRTKYAHFLPEDLAIDGNVQPEKRYRGIYVVMLYNTKLKMSGYFKKPDIEALGLKSEAILWNKAFLSVGITDLKGIKDTIKLSVNAQSLPVNPGIPSSDILSSGVSAPLQLDKEKYEFSCELNLNGSTQLSFLPLGKKTAVSLTSPWPSPSFVGDFLPDNRKVADDGFKASWQVLQYNRNFPQQGLGAFISTKPSDNYAENTDIDIAAAAPIRQSIASFGVKLLLPVDEYQKTMRSAKYDIMFILITFIAFFFVEILNQKRIHPIQYLLVGFAVCLFYLLLLSISEHLSFNWAYLIGCGLILSLVTFYVKHIFQSTRLTLLFSGILALLYGFFYSLLQLEDYSLLLGSAGLVLILGAVMYLTRNINWYKAYN
jgi:inner membrane protein